MYMMLTRLPAAGACQLPGTICYAVYFYSGRCILTEKLMRGDDHDVEGTKL